MYSVVLQRNIFAELLQLRQGEEKMRERRGAERDYEDERPVIALGGEFAAGHRVQVDYHADEPL